MVVIPATTAPPLMVGLLSGRRLVFPSATLGLRSDGIFFSLYSFFLTHRALSPPPPVPCPLSPFPLSPRLSSLVLAPKLLGLGRKISEIGYRLKYVRLSHVKYLSRAG